MLSHDTERVVGPRRQSQAEVAYVTADVRARRAPDVRAPAGVVLNDELTNWREVFTEQRPVQLDHSAVTDGPVDINWSVWNICVIHITSVVITWPSIKVALSVHSYY